MIAVPLDCIRKITKKVGRRHAGSWGQQRVALCRPLETTLGKIRQEDHYMKSFWEELSQKLYSALCISRCYFCSSFRRMRLFTSTKQPELEQQSDFWTVTRHERQRFVAGYRQCRIETVAIKGGPNSYRPLQQSDFWTVSRHDRQRFVAGYRQCRIQTVEVQIRIGLYNSHTSEL